MVNLSVFPPGYFGNFFLVLVRVSAMILTAPLLQGRATPTTIKVGLALLISFLLVPINQAHFVDVPFQWLPLSTLVLQEMGVGVLVGFVVNLVFSAAQLAGQFLGLQAGFNLANILDPFFSQSVSLLDQVFTILVGLIFLAMDGHHLLIMAIQQTFDIVPIGSFHVTSALIYQLITLSAAVFVAGLRLALPVMAALLLADISLGLMARSFPQVNVFIVGLPVKLFLTFFLLVATMPALNTVIQGFFNASFLRSLQPDEDERLMPAQDKTEDATPKRKGEARKKGQVARSAELSTATAMLTAWIVLRIFGPGLVQGLMEVSALNFQDLLRPELTSATVEAIVISHFAQVVKFMLPIAGALMLAGLVTNIAQVGFLFTATGVTPNFGKLNPISGFKRFINVRSLVELFKGLAKLAVVGFLAYKSISDHELEILELTGSDLIAGISLIASIASELLLRVGLAYLILAIADYTFQRRQMKNELKMTKQEVKEEAKSQEQAQEVKSRIRSLQRQLARRRMMQRVPYADVVITNPTHFAVALQYDPAKMAAPRVVAKGQRLMAQQIKDLARKSGVPLVENKPLAQALFKAVDVDQEIPGELYQAVAEVLAFIYRLKQRAS